MSRPLAVLQVQFMPSCLADRFPFDQPVLTLGRADDNDVIIENPLVSRHHLRLELAGLEHVIVTDLGSANGIWIQGKPIPPRTPTPVAFGEEIGLVDMHLSVTVPEPGSTTPYARRVKITGWRKPGLAVICNGELHKYPLDKEAIILGRAADNDIVIDDVHVSRHHARITQAGNAFYITDLGSTNKLLLRGQPVTDAPLNDGDLFTVEGSQVTLRFCNTLGFVPVEPLTLEPQTVLFKPGSQSTAFLNLKGRDVIQLGRAADNSIVLSNAMISQHHALIERMGGRYRIKDLKSESGVYVNGVRIEKEAWLKQGDSIHVGGVHLILQENGVEQVSGQGWQISAIHLNKWVSKDKNLLKDISLCIYPQEFVALVGMSGSGKSTLLDALNGFRPATQGQVLVNGIDIYHHFDLFRNEMGYVPQKDIVHQELTVYKALDYAAQLRMPADTSPQERHERIIQVINDLDLVERQDLPIFKLSGGQLKRVSIGVELLTEPHLFFLDEPTSGLDPGTELEMMKLLRHLADQGRTVMLITHATKNVMMCDKVTFLARGGYVAFFGPPEEALTYFDQYRTPQEKQRKDIEFDDIYMILNDSQRGSGADWDARYRKSNAFKEYVIQRLQLEKSFLSPDGAPGAPASSHPPLKGGQVIEKKRPQAGIIRQFGILSARNLRIMVQDKFGLALMLALAPIIGLMDFIWGSSLFDIQHGDVTKIITMLFMVGLITILVGAMASVREIVKEIDIYKRERAINLKLPAYILSKIWVGFILSIYQAVVLLLFLYVFALHNSSLSFVDYGLFLVTMFLGTLSGYMMGLCISAAAPNQNVALLLVIVVLVPQFLFSGALLPLDLIPGGKVISAAASTRWAFEAMVNITGVGRDVIDDPCWQLARSQHLQPSDLSEDKKVAMGCQCMGSNLFITCNFPGIQDPEFYTAAARQALVAAKPLEPLNPTAYPSFTPAATLTAYPSITPYPTLTPIFTLTPMPTPADMRLLNEYQSTREAQGKEYQDLSEVQGKQYEQSRLDQGKEYEQMRVDQGKVYEQMRVDQGNAYQKMRVAQGDEYASAMKQYGDARQSWQQDREKAIGAAENTIKAIVDNYSITFEGNVISRWLAMCIIIVVVFGLLVIFQKRKDLL